MACVVKCLTNSVTVIPKATLEVIFINLSFNLLDLDTSILAAKSNDQKAYNYILNSFWGEVYGFVLKRTKNENDAEDITIQTFAKAFDKIQSYNPEYQFKTWLMTIAKNIHIDHIRRAQTNIQQESEQSHLFTIARLADENPTPEDAIIIAQKLSKLRTDIKKLKPHYQEVIQLFYFQELSYIEIADTLQEPLSRIKVKLLRARQLLASIIDSTRS